MTSIKPGAAIPETRGKGIGAVSAGMLDVVKPALLPGLCANT
jgi:hypothetical protein